MVLHWHEICHQMAAFIRIHGNNPVQEVLEHMCETDGHLAHKG